MSEKTEITFMQTRLIRLASEEWHLPVEQIIHLFKETDVLGYMEKCYGIFHCEGDEAVLEDITEFLQGKGIEISAWVKSWICSLSWKLLWSKRARSCQMCKEKRFWVGILFNHIQGAGRKFSKNLNSQSNRNRNNWRGTEVRIYFDFWIQTFRKSCNAYFWKCRCRLVTLYCSSSKEKMFIEQIMMLTFM